MPKIKIAIADDHTLMRKALVNLLNDHQFTVVAQAENGRELIELVEDIKLDVVLMDINMPIMNGFETTDWLRRKKPTVKVLALSMFADDASVIRMIKAGAKGYILKDAEPQALRNAICELMENGVFYSDFVNDKMMNKMNGKGETLVDALISLTAREEEFLNLACSEMNMREIADKMNISPRTVDGYREQLFVKLNVQTRTGLVLYAIKNRLYLLD